MENRITALTNPRIRRITALQTRARVRRQEQAFVTEGLRLFSDTPEAFIEEVYCTEAFASDPRNAAKLARTGYTLVPPELLGKISDTMTQQGVLCVVRTPSYSLPELLGGQGRRPLLLVLEDVQDPGNLGTMFRTAEAAGATGILMSRGTVDVTNPKTVRATMSSIFRVPFCYTDELPENLRRLKRRGIRICAALLREAEEYDSASYIEGTALLVGNEGSGLSPETAAEAELHVRIPMEGQIESLNAAMAAGILLYEAARQRRNSQEGA